MPYLQHPSVDVNSLENIHSQKENSFELIFHWTIPLHFLAT
jgi:hypothetical protein